MRVVALLGPAASPRAVERFSLEGSENVQLEIGSGENISEADAVLVFGGDGTVHRYLPQLHAHQVPVLVVPKGSGNDFARALGIRTEKIALHAWRQFCAGRNNVGHIDLGVAKSEGQESLFCCVAGSGLDSAANTRANRMPGWLRGSVGYLIAALQELALFQPVEVRLTTETRSDQRSAFLVAVGNARSYGGGMKIVPWATLDDGWLDVCVVGRMSKWKILVCLPTIFFGKHIGIAGVEYFQARTVRIEPSCSLEIYADGEFIGRTPVEISLRPRALQVIVPA